MNISDEINLRIRLALEEFCDNIDATGGLVEDPENEHGYVPAGADDWPDLADTYLEACKALGRSPTIG